MTTATVREAIHERLDPVIEEIVSREISQRGGGYSRGIGQEQGSSFEALMPVLLTTLIQRRQVGQGQEPQQLLQSLLPILPVLIQNLTRRQGGQGQEPQQILQSLLPVLPALLPLLMQRRQAGQEPQQILQNILPILPALLPLIMQRRQGSQIGQVGQEHPLQTLAPVLVAALSACS
jgi:hypothetical protein